MILLLIHRMTATFGKLQNQTLELKNGLNIIQAPNETGKSTWCAFLLSMLYGINSRERERAGFIPDKIRYAPWSGSSMGGRLDCLSNGQELTITRTTRRQTAPLGDFQAVYAGTGDNVPDLTGPTCGETLLGVSREVFERSAFIRQAGLPISQDAGLERRIASLITSGEEDTSYSETAEALKKQLNRRRHNKTGQIPTLEAKLQSVRQQLTTLEQLEAQLQHSRTQAQELASQEASLAAELALHQRWEAAQRRRALAEAETAACQAEQRAAALRQRLEADHVPENETIARLRGAIVNLETTRKNVEKARAERDEAAKSLLRAEAAVNESPFAGQTAESARRDASEPPKVVKWNPVPGAAVIFCGVLLAFAGFYFALLHTNSKFIGAITLFILLAATFVLANFLKKRAFQASRNETLLKRFGTTDQAEIVALADTYIKLLDAREAAQSVADQKSAIADTLYNSLSSNEQGILLEIRRFAPSAFEVSTADALLRECAQRRKGLSEAESAAKEARMRCELLAQQAPTSPDKDNEDLTPPIRSRDAVTAELAQVRAALTAARSATDHLTGQLHAIGDPVILQSTAEHLEEQLRTLENEYNAIRLAMDALDTANTTLQNRFSPALGKRAAEIFRELTDQRYSSVVLDRTFRLSAEPVGDTVHRDAQLLSAGTTDQLYLAARLAICDLVLPSQNAAPIILDDALANFDNERCAAALRWLKEESRKRQILLFSCHSREAEFFANDGEVFVQRLTDAAEQV